MSLPPTKFMTRKLTSLIAQRVSTLIGLSLGLGLAFNAANPIGIKRGGEKPVADKAADQSSISGHFSKTTNGVYQNEVLALSIRESASTARSLNHSNHAPILSLTWEETKSLVDSKQAVLVDARPASAFSAGHIPGAVSLPLMDAAARRNAFLEEYAEQTPLIVYCGSASCPIAERLAAMLASDFGYQSVKLFPGGYSEWQRLELANVDAPSSLKTVRNP